MKPNRAHLQLEIHIQLLPMRDMYKAPHKCSSDSSSLVIRPDSQSVKALRGGFSPISRPRLTILKIYRMSQQHAMIK